MAERTAGIVLAGGRSQRMGTSKADLEWHGSTLLRRAVGLVARAVDGPVVVVRAVSQQLPELPDGIEIAEDAREGRGPLQGIAAGLAQVGERAGVVYVGGVDAPLLHPAFVRRVLAMLRDEDEIAIPRVGGFAQPLAAAYRTSVAPRLRELLARERLATRSLLDVARVRELDAAALLADAGLAAADPQLDSLLNLNAPDDYRAARARPAPNIAVRVAGEPGSRAVRAATLAAAAAAVGHEPGSQLTATLDGHGPRGDPQEPLAEGDAVSFRTIADRSAGRP